jgi:hypothetical protein
MKGKVGHRGVERSPYRRTTFGDLPGDGDGFPALNFHRFFRLGVGQLPGLSLDMPRLRQSRADGYRRSRITGPSQLGRRDRGRLYRRPWGPPAPSIEGRPVMQATSEDGGTTRRQIEIGTTARGSVPANARPWIAGIGMTES